MPPIEPKRKVIPPRGIRKPMHPTTPKRLAERVASLEREMKRLKEEPIVDRILLGCGCQVVIHNFNGVMVKYCPQHNTFIFSPNHDEGDVFYFVNEEQRP